jgi:membrane protein DedA with SNARE-associated domain
MSIDLQGALLTALLAYGAPLLGGVLLAGAVGAPIPGTLLLMAAGAFARQGYLPVYWAAGLSFVGAAAGDSLSYWIGRAAGSRLNPRLSRQASWGQAEAQFRRRGGAAVFLTRFLLTPLALPVNLIAGGSLYSFYRYVVWVILGEAVWVGLYMGLGWEFWDQWETISGLAADFGWALLGILAAGAGVILLLRWGRKKGPEPVQKNERPRLDEG